MKQIEIHEFSTGVSVEGNPNNWVSRGFTGTYLNSTLTKIPFIVQKAISDRELSIAERAATDTPTLIAREIGEQEEVWSIVAVITRARDDGGRYLPVYRYFLTQGKGNIAPILRWFNNKLLVFDPFDVQEIDQPHHFSYEEKTKIPLDNFQEFLTGETPLIIPFNKQLNPLIINSIATEKAGENLVAWAYNVTGLEIPKSFDVIVPINAEAEDNLRQILVTKSTGSKIIKGEHSIKTAISGLMSREKVKLEHLQTLENALSNPDIDHKFWEEIFNGRGAQDAISQQLYSAQMIRLLTLKAIIIPFSLPQFLNWMGKNTNKEQNHWEISLNFQNNILQKLQIQNFPSIYLKIDEGVKFLLLYLLDKPQILNSTIKLLKNNTGIWANFYRNGMRKYLENDLNLMPKLQRLQYSNLTEEIEKLPFILKHDKNWQEIFKELMIFWQGNSRNHIIEKYYVWGQLFEALKNYKLAALFYQISSNQVPKSVFEKFCRFSYGTNFRDTLYGIYVYREIELSEQIFLQIIEFLKIILDLIWKGLQLLDKYRYEVLLTFIAALLLLNILTMFIVKENLINIYHIIIDNYVNNH